MPNLTKPNVGKDPIIFLDALRDVALSDILYATILSCGFYTFGLLE
tara:strand:+ start:4415 stop:4552 length:138 start_codon:yes stop_codon:yes gene_type:complete